MKNIERLMDIKNNLEYIKEMLENANITIKATCICRQTDYGTTYDVAQTMGRLTEGIERQCDEADYSIEILLERLNDERMD